MLSIPEDFTDDINIDSTSGSLSADELHHVERKSLTSMTIGRSLIRSSMSANAIPFVGGFFQSMA